MTTEHRLVVKEALKIFSHAKSESESAIFPLQYEDWDIIKLITPDLIFFLNEGQTYLKLRSGTQHSLMTFVLYLSE